MSAAEARAGSRLPYRTPSAPCWMLLGAGFEPAHEDPQPTDSKPPAGGPPDKYTTRYTTRARKQSEDGHAEATDEPA